MDIATSLQILKDNEDVKYILIDTNIKKDIVNDFIIKEGTDVDFIVCTVISGWKQEILKVLTRVTDVDPKPMCDSIIELIDNVIGGYNFKHGLIKIRITSPNDKFKIPRYHYDGSELGNKVNLLDTKYIVTIKGPGTIIFNCTSQVFEEFKQYFLTFERKGIPETRIKLEEFIKDNGELLSSNNKGCIFKVNELIHSEPNITEPRIFLSINSESEQKIFNRYIKDRVLVKLLQSNYNIDESRKLTGKIFKYLLNKYNYKLDIDKENILKFINSINKEVVRKLSL